MTEHTSFIEEFPSHGHDMLQAVVGTVISLAVAAVFGAWVLVHQNTAGPPAREEMEQRSQAAAAIQQSDQPASTASTPRADHASGENQSVVPAQAPVPAIFLVASDEAATALQAKLDEGSAIRDALGLPPLDDQIVVFSSVEEEVLFWLACAEESTVSQHLGAPAPRVVDLR